MPDVVEDSLASFWMPFTNNKGFKAQPRLLASARGMHFTSRDGNRILDGTAGLWCVNAGHCHPAIVRAIQDQAEVLDFAPTFQLGHPLPFQLAETLKAFFPGEINRTFFTNSGSESADTALKIALAYQRAKGFKDRNILIGRDRGYHGVGFGGISVGGIARNSEGFTTLANVEHLPATVNLQKAAFSKGQPTWGAELADDLFRIIEKRGAERIAAVIVEPIAGSTGALVPPVGYLERLRQITAEHGILLIFDEVITAFGRVGAATAAERFGVIPDIITIAKGLTNGAVPMGAVGVSEHIHDTVIGDTKGIEFFHGYTYSGHPLAAAAALATLKVYEDEDLFARARALEPLWEEAAHGLAQERNVIDVRNFGLIAGIELQPRDGNPGGRAFELFHRCFDDGLLIRVTADTVALSPPLIIEESQIAEIFGKLAKHLRALD